MFCFSLRRVVVVSAAAAIMMRFTISFSLLNTLTEWRNGPFPYWSASTVLSRPISDSWSLFSYPFDSGLFALRPFGCFDVGFFIASPHDDTILAYGVSSPNSSVIK